MPNQDTEEQKRQSPIITAKTALKSPSMIPVLVVAVLILSTVALLFDGFGGGGISGTTATEEFGEEESGAVEPTAPGTTDPGETTPAGELPSRDEFFNVIYNIQYCTSLDQDSTVGCGPASESQKEFVYSILSVPLTSPTYKTKLISKGRITILLRRPPPAGGTSGGAEYGGSKIQYWGYIEAGNNRITRVSMVHETGHILRLRNDELNQFPLNQLAQNAEDSDCYTEVTKNGQKTYYIKTYKNKTNGKGGTSLSETLAEAIGMNVYAGPGSVYSKGIKCNTENPFPNCSETITDYPTACPNTYNWVQEHVFGGTDFFNPAPASRTTPGTPQ